MRLGPDELIESVAGASSALAERVARHRGQRHGRACASDLVAELLGYCRSRFEEGDEAAVGACLEVLDRALVHGDAEVQRLIGVGFVEASGPWEPASQPFIDTWPTHLRADARGYQIARDEQP